MSEAKITMLDREASEIHAPVLKTISPEQGLADYLPPAVVEFVEDTAMICTPKDIHICDGSKEEAAALMQTLSECGMTKKLTKMDNCWLTLTDPADVARVESKTVIASSRRRDTVPKPKEGVRGLLGHWISTDELEGELAKRFPNCMKGRTMYVVPFSMGPVGGPLSKIGIELTDSPYVAACMGIMTRMGKDVLEALKTDTEYVHSIHSVGQPLPMAKEPVQHWPCNPTDTLISHCPERNLIASYGSGYGGNSLLGKKCLALRLGSIIGHREGWLAEHMLIVGVTPPNGKKRYIAGAFPSQCGKTNLAMLLPSIPGYKIECVGDDIAWMRFDKDGTLRAINPEAGFFGVAPGTSHETNPTAMDTVMKNTVFTNVAETADGGVFWEGLEKEVDISVGVTDWQGKPWTPGCGRPAAHPNSRFCSPMEQYAQKDPKWDSSEGVPIDAILFGGRRPEGFPLVFESLDWENGVFYGAAMRSQTTAAAEHKGKAIMHDPFAMRPFLGYNLGDYIQHWLSMPQLYKNAKLPKIYQVNWFRQGGPDNKFLWPGFGENIRVLDWILQRIEGDPDTAIDTPIGRIPNKEKFNLAGLEGKVDWDELFSTPKEFWMEEAAAIEKYFDEQIGEDLPLQMKKQLTLLKERLNK